MTISPINASNFDQLRHNPWRWTELHCVVHTHLLSTKQFVLDKNYPHFLVLTKLTKAIIVYFDEHTKTLLPTPANKIGNPISLTVAGDILPSDYLIVDTVTELPMSNWHLWKCIPKQYWPQRYKDLSSTNCDICSFLLHPDQVIREFGELIQLDKNLDDTLKGSGFAK